MLNMAQALLEHVNLTVSNPERTADMLADLFGWHIRWQGPGRDGGRTIHVGSESHYVAVYADPKMPGEQAGFVKGVPLNHVGILVDDLDAIETKVIARGLTPFSHGDYDPGRRFYFFDFDGIEFEVISYAPVSAHRL
jgi:catechol 2,3-dioxygenase-like lactoylglutathione lyase family enzyme